jgi:D-alanyl-D-alanine carboxypeptidase (penicillin-binding protein 5/6)
MGDIDMMRKFNRILILFLLFVLILSSTSFATVGIENEVSAYLLGDFETGEILEEYNIYKPVEIASITKLMSYLIIMEDVQRGKISLDDVVYIDKDTAEIKGSSLELQEGESFTVGELLKAVLVVSANDATYALSKYAEGTEEAFVRRMNDKAKSLGLKSTVYFNSTGLPQGDVQNMMSPEDIFNLSRYIIDKYPEILSVTTIPYIEVPSRNYKEENTDPLLNEINGVDGLKTGFTNKAGYCLVSTIGVNGKTTKDKDFRLIGIVMGTKSEGKRKELGKTVVQYGLDNYSKRIVTDKNTSIDTIHMAKSKDKEIEVYPEKNYSTMFKNGDTLDVNITIDEEIKLPLKEFDKVGKATILKNNEVIDEMDLLVHKDVKKEGLFRVIGRNIKEFLSFLFSKITG